MAEESAPVTESSSVKKSVDDPSGGLKSSQFSIMSVYQAAIAGACRYITVTWSKNIMAHTLCFLVDGYGDGNQYTCKIDLKPWHFWNRKGFKQFDVAGDQIDVFWDLRTAKFSGGPEPQGEFYVAVVCQDEVVLLLGELKKEAYRKTRSRPSLFDAVLLSKKENVFGKKCFVTRAKFDGTGKEHDIVVENSISTSKEDPEMWISIDGNVVVHVKGLFWKFRGNDTVSVDNMSLQVFWDVHDWLFGGGSGHALFIFKPGLPEISQSDEESSFSGCSVTGFSLILYAWKLE
ncbi:uncharacterized protein LOC116259162 [Nymphaea colorata]|uniref:DUF868 domain-containing protein n=1 Tax=Nymphaea colorata TaxID=210225 RepID=A0A5K1FRJ1_9MAGN|nr:uncharacterized protein LOC116259162 [Nymphaea colorata]